VHEVGFMMMLLMPCFYCNVSDAWLIKEKSRRLWVTAARHVLRRVPVGARRLRLARDAAVLAAEPRRLGGHVDLRRRVFMNVNPLVKLDGYYLASDWLEIPNLRQRAIDHVAGHLRWVLWGAPRPEAEPRGMLLFCFGAASWGFTLFYIGLVLFGLHRWLLYSLGLGGTLLTAGLTCMLLPALTAGLFNGEVLNMLRNRWKRTAIWIGGIVAMAALLHVIQIDDWVSGTFRTRATVRAEIRAPVSGFCAAPTSTKASTSPRGAARQPGGSRSRQQAHPEAAEEREVEAKLRLLEAGARPEEIAELKQKVGRASNWCELADKDLQRRRVAHKEELSRLDESIAAAATQVKFNAGLADKAKRLVERGALPRDQYDEANKQVVLSQSHLAQMQAQKRERESLGTLDQENELARRHKEHATPSPP